MELTKDEKALCRARAKVSGRPVPVLVVGGHNGPQLRHQASSRFRVEVSEVWILAQRARRPLEVRRRRLILRLAPKAVSRLQPLLRTHFNSEAPWQVLVDFLLERSDPDAAMVQEEAELAVKLGHTPEVQWWLRPLSK